MEKTEMHSKVCISNITLGIEKYSHLNKQVCVRTESMAIKALPELEQSSVFQLPNSLLREPKYSPNIRK